MPFEIASCCKVFSRQTLIFLSVCACVCVYVYMSLMWIFSMLRMSMRNFFGFFFYGFQDDSEWMNWQNVLSERNAVENVYKWACGYVLFNYDVPFK